MRVISCPRRTPSLVRALSLGKSKFAKRHEGAGRKAGYLEFSCSRVAGRVKMGLWRSQAVPEGPTEEGGGGKEGNKGEKGQWEKGKGGEER